MNILFVLYSVYYLTILCRGDIKVVKCWLRIAFHVNISDISFADEGLIKVENLGSEKWEPITRIRIGNYSSTNGFQGALSKGYFFLKRTRVTQRIFGDSNYHLDRVAKINNY